LRGESAGSKALSENTCRIQAGVKTPIIRVRDGLIFKGRGGQEEELDFASTTASIQKEKAHRKDKIHATVNKKVIGGDLNHSPDLLRGKKQQRSGSEDVEGRTKTGRRTRAQKGRKETFKVNHKEIRRGPSS